MTSDDTLAPDRTFELKGAGDLSPTAYRWDPADPPRAAVMVVHGMAEHALRYGRFARVLNRAGYVAYAFDLRGHGATGTRQGLLGHFADESGWRRCVGDISTLRAHISAEHPDVPLLLFAHSMGSLLGQDFLVHHGHSVSGVVLSGTGGGLGWILRLGEAMARIERARVGPRATSALLDYFALGDPCKDFRPCRTESDWLTRDPIEVDKYQADPLCGFSLTTQTWVDISCGLIGVERRQAQAQVPKDLPVLLLSGAVDPVGRGGAGPRWVATRYREAGLRDVELKLYPEARHEVLNEVNRDEVHADIMAFYQRLL